MTDVARDLASSATPIASAFVKISLASGTAPARPLGNVAVFDANRVLRSRLIPTIGTATSLSTPISHTKSTKSGSPKRGPLLGLLYVVHLHRDVDEGDGVKGAIPEPLKGVGRARWADEVVGLAIPAGDPGLAILRQHPAGIGGDRAGVECHFGIITKSSLWFRPTSPVRARSAQPAG